MARKSLFDSGCGIELSILIRNDLAHPTSAIINDGRGIGSNLPDWEVEWRINKIWVYIPYRCLQGA